MKANLIVISRSPKNTGDHFKDQMFVEESDLDEMVKCDISIDGNFNGEYNDWFISIDSWFNHSRIPDMDYLDYVPEPVYDPESNYKNGRWVTFKDLFHMYQKIKGSDQNIPFCLAFDMVNRRVVEIYNMEVACVLVGDKAKILFDMIKKMPSIAWVVED